MFRFYLLSAFTLDDLGPVLICLLKKKCGAGFHDMFPSLELRRPMNPSVSCRLLFEKISFKDRTTGINTAISYSDGLCYIICNIFIRLFIFLLFSILCI